MNLSAIDRDIQAALRSQDTTRLKGLHALRDSVTLATSQKRAGLTEAEVQAVIRRDIEERQTAANPDNEVVEVLTSFLVEENETQLLAA